MSRIAFDLALQNLNDELLKMCEEVKNQIRLSIKSLVNKDVELAKQVVKGDDIVDNLNKEIEDKCVRFIATEQPLAKDLREIFTAIKVVTDLERMADYAVDIAKITIHLQDEEYVKKLIQIPELAEKVLNVIGLAIDAYIKGDSKRAYEICKMDDEIDDLYKQILEELFNMMVEDNSTAAQTGRFMFVVKNLERIGDHVTNICEWTIYSVEGKYVDLNE
ncbi:MAG: phosphate signaling complex protein PhoU [Clostridium perfringens]|nr:phosphate signaling complex protein PhoU [Clostridium perfringens]